MGRNTRRYLVRRNARHSADTGLNAVKALCTALYSAALKGILSWGFEQELISVNPWKDYKALRKEKTYINVSMDSFKAIYDVAQPWLKWAMKTAFCCCLRFGHVELFGLQWNNFDFKHGKVTIKQGKSGLPKTVFPPLPYMEEAHQRFMDDQKHGYELVCRSRRNKQVTYYSHSWHKTCDKAGVFATL